MNEVNERALMSKVTWRLIPFMFLLYIINYLDRVNVGFAKLQMQDALHFNDTIFGTGMGIFFIWYLPNGPQDAKWLTPEERDYIQARLAPEKASASHKHDHLGQALLCPRVWLLCAIYFCTATGSYGFTFWLPSILKATFHTSDQN